MPFQNIFLALLHTICSIILIYLKTHSNSGNGIHLPLDPGSDGVGLLGELAPQVLIVLLLTQFRGQGAVALGYQLPHVRPFTVQLLEK